MSMIMISLCLFSATTTICVFMCSVMAVMVTRLRRRIVELEQRTRWLLPVSEREFKDKLHGHGGWRKEHNTAH